MVTRPNPANRHCPDHGDAHETQSTIKACHKSTEIIVGAGLSDICVPAATEVMAPARRFASIQVDIPTGIDPTSVRAMPSDFAPTPAVARNAGGVASIKWSRDPSELQSDDSAYYEITLRLKVNDVPFTRIPFVITQVCRPKGGTPADDVTVVWTGPSSNPEPSPQLIVVPAHSVGWNKLVLTTAIAAADLGAYFGDAQIVWKGTAAFSPNATVTGLITTTTGATKLSTDLAAGDEIWVKY